MKQSITFEYDRPTTVVITMDTFRETLGKVRYQLLTHRINGGDHNLEMNVVCDRHGCGTAACIGGWVSIFLLGYEAATDEQRITVNRLFDTLQQLGDRVHQLFFDYDTTSDYNQPNVAATAIQRYLDGQKPWPRGDMPNVLPYKRARATKKPAKTKKK